MDFLAHQGISELVAACCHELTFLLEDSDLLDDYSAFAGHWTKDGNMTYFSQRPVYRKLDNPNLYLASVEVRFIM